MKVICNFCSNEFKNNNILKKHQKTAKFCLIIQGILTDTKEEKKTEKKIYECYDCFSILSSKNSYLNHLTICKAKKIREIKDIENKRLNQLIYELNNNIEELKQENQKLILQVNMYKSDHECVQEIAKQPKHTTTTTNYLNLSPLFLKKSDIKNQINNNFLEENFLQGQEGVATFTYNNFLLDENGNTKYPCSDKNRRMFVFKSKDGNIDKDFEAQNLTSLIYDDVLNKSIEIRDSKINKTKELDEKIVYMQNFEEIKNLKDNNMKFAKKLVTLTQQKKNSMLDDEDDEDENDDKDKDKDKDKNKDDEINEYVIEESSNEEEINDNPYGLSPLYNSIMKEEIKKMTIDDIIEGVNGYINFALKNTFKNRIKCIEYTKDRSVFVYVDKNNRIVKDTDYSQFEQFLKVSYDKTMSECQEYKDKIRKQINSFGDEIKEEYIKIIDNLSQTQRDIKKIYNNEIENDFFNNFVSGLSKRLYISNMI